MRKFLCLLFVPLMVLAVSCKKDEQNNNDKKVPVPEAIDLGITVGGKTVKWASFNIGASKPWVYATDDNGNEVKDANGNIIYGLRITRKSSNAVLFLPAAGYREKADLVMAGIHGAYLSNSLKSTYSNPWKQYLLEFGSETDDMISIGSRDYGLSVRPVYVE